MQEGLKQEGLNNVFRYHVSGCEGQVSHEGLILYLKENVLASQARQGKEGMGQVGHEGLILYLKENDLARERV